jgi:Flp pilus assembly protein TadB
MKNLNILSLLIIAVLLFAVQPASAVVSVQNNQETATAAVNKKDLKKQERVAKVMTKIQKKLDKMQKKGIDTKDPVNKWLWFAIIAGVLAVVLSILGWFTFGFAWYLSGLAWTAATVFFVVWLLKMLEVI